MKNILIVAILSTFAISNTTESPEISTKSYDEEKRLCKVSIKKAHDYRATMSNDLHTDRTLALYKDEITSYCGKLVAKAY